MRVEWNSAKDIANQRKHGISFEEARRLFVPGADYLEIFDDQHSVSEDRFICIGPIRRGVIVVVKTEPAEDVIRIVSARLATRREIAMYGEFVERGEV